MSYFNGAKIYHAQIRNYDLQSQWRKSFIEWQNFKLGIAISGGFIFHLSPYNMKTGIPLYNIYVYTHPFTLSSQKLHFQTVLPMPSMEHVDNICTIWKPNIFTGEPQEYGYSMEMVVEDWSLVASQLEDIVLFTVSIQLWDGHRYHCCGYHGLPQCTQQQTNGSGN